MKNKTLFFGPFPEPYTGQSILFKQVFDNFNQDKILFNSTRFNGHKVLNSLYCLFFLPLYFIFFKFDRVYFTCTRSNLGFIKDFQLLILVKFFKKKVVNHLHGSDLITFYQNSGIFKKVIKWSYSKIDTNIVLLPSMKEQFRYFKNSNLEVVTNCYSNEFNNYQGDVSNKKNQIVFLSNLIFSKGILVFLDSIKELLKNNRQVVVKIAGSPMGDDFMSTKEIQIIFNKTYDALKVLYPKQIFYLGVVKGKAKESLLRESAIFVLPTFYKTEGFPLTIIEAMFYANAVITTNHNYLADIINEENGYLIKPRSTNELLNSLEALLNNESKLTEIQINNHLIAVKKFNPKYFNKKISDIINSI